MWVPAALTIDTFEGDYYISIVAFTMQKIRPGYLPAISFISDFHEINIRTYVIHGNRRGVYFLNIEAQKYLSVFIAKQMSGLPYEKSNIKRTKNSYTSINPKKQYSLDIIFNVEEPIAHKTDLDNWLTERYCLYLENRNCLFRYDIHHKPWQLNKLKLHKLHLQYQIGLVNLSDLKPDDLHYSNGVKVIAWARQKIG